MMQIEIGLRMVDNDTAVLLNSSVSFTPMEVRSVLKQVSVLYINGVQSKGQGGITPEI